MFGFDDFYDYINKKVILCSVLTISVIEYVQF